MVELKNEQKTQEKSLERSQAWWATANAMSAEIDALPIDDDRRKAVYKAIAEHVVEAEIEASADGFIRGIKAEYEHHLCEQCPELFPKLGEKTHE